MKQLPRYWSLLASYADVRPYHGCLLLILGMGTVIAEAFGLTMMLPVIEYIELDGDLSALESKNAIWETVFGIASAVQVPISLGLLAGFVIGAVLLRQGFDYFHAITMASLTANVQRQLRLKAYERFQASRLGFVQDVGSGQFLNLMDRQVEGASLILQNCANVSKYFFTFIVYGGVMVAAAPLSSAASFAMIVMLVFIVQRYVRRTRALSIELVKFRSKYSGFIEESFRAARTVRILNLDGRQQELLDRMTVEYGGLMVNLARMVARVPLTIAPLIAAIIMGYLFFTFTYLDMTTSAITLFALVLMRLAPTAQSFAKQQQNFTRFGANLEAMAKFLNSSEDAREPLGGDAEPGRIVAGITFDDVSFTYPGRHQPSIDRVSIMLKPGRIIAVKGPSGAGKSTFADLLPALISPDTGSILFNGVPIGSFEKKQLRGEMSYAAQEAFLFAGNVYDNIRLSRPEADDEAVETACKAAYAHEFVMALPNGYDTDLGEAGARLSGGQKQRLALARCFLKEASVLILDEPSSALDPESERMLWWAIRDYVETHNALALVITHREATYRDADELIEMDQGQIVRHEKVSEQPTDMHDIWKANGT